jgi:hypothetical protein
VRLGQLEVMLREDYAERLRQAGDSLSANVVERLRNHVEVAPTTA